jgi:hypothetical protein
VLGRAIHDECTERTRSGDIQVSGHITVAHIWYLQSKKKGLEISDVFNIVGTSAEFSMAI